MEKSENIKTGAVARRDLSTLVQIGDMELLMDFETMTRLTSKLQLACEQHNLATCEADTRAETPNEDRYFAH